MLLGLWWLGLWQWGWYWSERSVCQDNPGPPAWQKCDKPAEHKHVRQWLRPM